MAKYNLVTLVLKHFSGRPYVKFTLSNGKQVNKLFYSTNINRSAKQILKYYQARYQMEFIFRDAKQYTGLE